VGTADRLDPGFGQPEMAYLAFGDQGLHGADHVFHRHLRVDAVLVEHVSAGRLVSVLEDWSQTFPGYHAYYATRNSSPALGLVIEALRQAHAQ
jgi:DNA-binding transcriptional LysR family regulator